DTFRTVVASGTDHPLMPGFSVEAGGPLTEDDLVDLETYVASWSVQAQQPNPSPAGWATFVVILGVLAILAVGGYYGGGFVQRGDDQKHDLQEVRGTSVVGSANRGDRGIEE